VRPELLHLPHDDLAVEHAEPLHTVHLLAVQGDEFDQLIDREIEVHVLAEPA
jgi:hypothetical protein